MLNVIIHVSCRKCLTVYYHNIIGELFNKNEYFHFASDLKKFYKEYSQYKVATINDIIVDFDKVKNFRASHIIRDPRDMIVSGYFYHKAGKEGWCNWKNPNNQKWFMLNADVPNRIQPEESYSDHLNRVSLEDGLISEIELRYKHFQALRNWNYNSGICHEMRYEDVIGNEEKEFLKLFKHYGFEDSIYDKFMYAVNKFKFKNQAKFNHVRNPAIGQHKKYFTNKVYDFFYSKHPDLINFLGY